MKNKFGIYALALSLAAGAAYAQNTTTTTTPSNDRKEDRKELRQDKKELAQDKRELKEDRREKRKDNMQRMAKELNLTDAQKTQMKGIQQNARTQMQAIRNDNSLTQDQKRAKIQELHQSTQTQMNGVLTPEQQQKWQTAKANHKGKMGKHGRGHRRGAGTQGF